MKYKSFVVLSLGFLVGATSFAAGPICQEVFSSQAFEALPIEPLQQLATAKVISEVSLNSGLTAHGELSGVIAHPLKSSEVAYLQFGGKVTLRDLEIPLEGQGPDVHSHGFGTPVGALKNGIRISTLKDHSALGLIPGERARMEFESGVIVEGLFIKSQTSRDGFLQIITWKDCRVTLNGKTLFAPSWGTFDMAVGERVVEVKL